MQTFQTSQTIHLRSTSPYHQVISRTSKQRFIFRRTAWIYSTMRSPGTGKASRSGDCSLCRIHSLHLTSSLKCLCLECRSTLPFLHLSRPHRKRRQALCCLGLFLGPSLLLASIPVINPFDVLIDPAHDYVDCLRQTLMVLTLNSEHEFMSKHQNCCRQLLCAFHSSNIQNTFP